MPRNKTHYAGIPSDLTLAQAMKYTRPRVSEKRFRHIEGVAAVARKLATEAGEDAFLAELAGWLHDACKEMKPKDLIARAKEFGLKLHPVEAEDGRLLHGPVGALTVSRELGITNKELLDAIAEHTLGAHEMTELSKIVFLADCLEESRDKSFTDPIWAALRSKKDRPNLDKAMLVAFNLTIEHLLASNRVIHPKTVEVRNQFLLLVARS